jgi:hypothetical protein
MGAQKIPAEKRIALIEAASFADMQICSTAGALEEQLLQLALRQIEARRAMVGHVCAADEAFPLESCVVDLIEGDDAELNVNDILGSEIRHGGGTDVVDYNVGWRCAQEGLFQAQEVVAPVLSWRMNFYWHVRLAIFSP